MTQARGSSRKANSSSSPGIHGITSVTAPGPEYTAPCWSSSQTKDAAGTAASA